MDSLECIICYQKTYFLVGFWIPLKFNKNFQWQWGHSSHWNSLGWYLECPKWSQRYNSHSLSWTPKSEPMIHGFWILGEIIKKLSNHHHMLWLSISFRVNTYTMIVPSFVLTQIESNGSTRVPLKYILSSSFVDGENLYWEFGIPYGLTISLTKVNGGSKNQVTST